MGTGKAAHLVNVIDFGLAKKFRDSKTFNHIPFKQDEMHGVGTSMFAAINTHLGIEASRRDDLESLAYMLIYFIRGTLPWRKLRAPSTAPVSTTPDISDATTPNGPDAYNPISATWDLIRDSKLANEPLLTVGLHPEFDVLYKYARGLEFDDLPDYEGLRRLFRGLGERMGMEYDDIYDWTVTSEGKKGPHPKRHPTRSVSEGSGRRRYCEACNAKGR
jgi:casein kinase I family protein HRR25